MKVVENWAELLEVVEDEFLAVIEVAKNVIEAQFPIEYEFLLCYKYSFTDDIWKALKGKLSEKAVTLLEEPITALVPNSESIVIGNYVTNVINIFDLDDTQLYNVFCIAWSDGRWIADFFYDGDFEENIKLKEAVYSLPAK